MRRTDAWIRVAIAATVVAGLAAPTPSASAATDPPSTYAGVHLTVQQTVGAAYAAGFHSEPALLAVVSIGIAESGLVTKARNWHTEFGYRPAAAKIGVKGPAAAWNHAHTRQLHSDRGAWQISSHSWPQYKDAQTDKLASAAKIMFAISHQGTNFTPWDAYTSGSNRRYYDKKSGPWPALRPIVRKFLAAQHR